MVVMAVRTAQMVGQKLLDAHQNRHRLELHVEEKGIDGPVTRLDRYVEELTIESLKKSYKNHSFLGEEFGFQEGRGHDADWCWIIDPLDGTLNFIQGIPHFCISIAVQHKGITQHAVIYDPVRDEVFSASRGRGAMLNQRRLRIEGKDSLQNTCLAVGHAYRHIRHGEIVSYAEQHFASLLAVTQAGAQVRRSGSAALDLAYVASNRYAGFFELGLKPWDIAGGELIVREAGGLVIDAQGGQNSLDNGQVIASSLTLLKTLSQVVVPAWGDACKV